MKKILIIGTFLLTHVCSSLGSESEDDSDLSKPYKITTNKRGETIFYPAKYSNYEELREEHITKLLAERLHLLCCFKQLYDQFQKTQHFPETDYVNYQDRLTRNEIVLKTNIDEELLNRLFGDNYCSNEITTDHMINIALASKERLSSTDVNFQKLGNIIEGIHSWENMKPSITLGTSTFLVH